MGGCRWSVNATQRDVASRSRLPSTTMKLGLIVIIVGSSAFAHAETWHVSTTGDDASAGTEAAPWRTIQHAANEAAAGDTVLVHDGTYVGFVVETRASEAAPLTFKADGEVLIDGAATVERDAILIQGGSHIVIEGFTVTGAARAGIAALDCDHITVRRNRTDQNGRWGVFTGFCDDLLIESNETSRSGTEHGIYASNSADRPVIRNNVSWGNARCGIHLNGDVNFGGDGVISDAVVEGNVIYDNGRDGGSGINGDGLVDAVIRNNVIDGNHASGISLYMIDGGEPSTGNLVINNTIRMASDGRWAINIQDGSTGNTLRNNILLHLNASRGAIDICASCVSGTVSDHNAVVGRFMVGGSPTDLDGWRAQTGNDAASFVSTPDELFAGPEDLRLSATSPAIDQGMSERAPEIDLLGTARPQGLAHDLGAYEYCEGDACGEGDGPDLGGEPVDPDAEAPEAGGCATGGSAGWLACALVFAFRRRRAR
jgi:hypothetical protein